RADARARAISRVNFDGSLRDLVRRAASMAQPVLIGVDAAIGYPGRAWAGLVGSRRPRPKTFIDFLFDGPRPPGFFAPVRRPEDWSPETPFISPPAGSWSLNEYIAASGDALYREIDRRLNGNPIFLMSGMPGTVGSGTCALWQELIALQRTQRFRVWPFHGSMGTLLDAGSPVIAEIYPKACYGIALAEALPATPCTIAKTKPDERLGYVRELRDAPWVARHMIAIEDWRAAEENEDDFDALFSAAALLRIVIENAALERQWDLEKRIEGSVLGAASLKDSRPRRAGTSGAPRAARKRDAPREGQRRQTYECPIADCGYMFQDTRGGWDAHVASVHRHPHWHPDVHDPAARKRLFRTEFPEWFR
ncbi:MAG: hypothetical protein D6807_05470, partial [Alphaproteobacteria bacterium]